MLIAAIVLLIDMPLICLPQGATCLHAMMPRFFSHAADAVMPLRHY